MSKIAVDIVLLPPEEVADLAIKLNRSTSGPKGNEIVLSKNEGEAMPHITLAMGVIEEKDLMEAEKVLDEVIQENKVLEITATGVYVGDHGNNKWAEISILNMKELGDLRKAVVSKLEPFLAYEVTGEMFYPPGNSNEKTPQWFNGFPNAKDFFPHITIGYGEGLEIKIGGKFPIKFKSARLAICHLGDYYTCRKILWSKDLND